ncbi:hypothetical protein CHUAL_006600 [Chamberlinius hualienensis]
MWKLLAFTILCCLATTTSTEDEARLNATTELSQKLFQKAQELLANGGSQLLQPIVSQLFGIIPTLSKSLSISKAIDLLSDYGILMSTNLTEQCVDDVKFFLKSLLTTEYGGPFLLWTFEFMDSFAKIPSGVIPGNINWLGDFEQCVNVEVPIPDSRRVPSEFKGEYCLVFLVIRGMEKSNTVFPKLGMCFPSSCTTQDKLMLLNYWMFLMPFKLGIQENYCYTKQGDPWTIYGTVAVVMIVGLVLMGIAGTLYECLLIWDEKNNNRYQFRLKTGDLIGSSLLAFSYYKNTIKIFNMEEPGSTISSIHGLKTFSMLWIAVVHVAVVTFQDYPWRNQLNALKIAKRDSWFIQLFADAAISTDIFFVISGLLVTFVTFNTMKKLKTKFNVFQFYLYRYWRLTPPYAVVLAIVAGLVVHLGEGPTWALIRNDAKKCQNYWWRNILYIQNLFPDFYAQCMLPSWYLAVDTQMYLIAPAFIIPLIKKPKLGVMVLIVGAIITTIAPSILTYIYDLETYTGITSRKNNMDSFADMIYNKPWNRISTYLIGMLVGYHMFVKGKDVKLKKSIVIFGWVSSLTVGCIILFGPVEYFRGKQMSPLLYAFYGGFVRPLFGSCVAWVVYACYIGYGGIINSILSWKGLIPISRLSYCFYLTHIVVIHHFYYSRQDSLRVEYFGLIILAAGLIFMSFLTAYLLAVIVEAPCIELLNVIVRKYKTKDNFKNGVRNGHVSDKKSDTFKNPLLAENGAEGGATQVTNNYDAAYQQMVYRRRQQPIAANNIQTPT